MAETTDQSKVPAGKIGNLKIGRVVCGSNLISPNMHARDLLYMNALARRYNTQERVFRTLQLCEELGINSAVLKSHNFKHLDLSRYWSEWGGHMKWIADVITRDVDKFERKLVEHLELGASAAYVWGGASDIWYHQGKPGHIVKAFEILKKYDIAAGIGSHRLEPIAFCEKEGLKPDFYFLTLHHHHYWSAHPKDNWRFIELYEKNSPDHAHYHDNMFHHYSEKTIDFMQTVKVPWMAFKVLAAGAIPPAEGLRYAFEGGADFVCLGMFDFQVREDVILTNRILAGDLDRKRPWMA
jgi:hypothetical protein